MARRSVFFPTFQIFVIDVNYFLKKSPSHPIDNSFYFRWYHCKSLMEKNFLKEAHCDPSTAQNF